MFPFQYKRCPLHVAKGICRSVLHCQSLVAELHRAFCAVRSYTQAGLLTQEDRAAAFPVSQWLLAVRDARPFPDIPFQYSDEFVQDLHLLPFSPAAGNRS